MANSRVTPICIQTKTLDDITCIFVLKPGFTQQNLEEQLPEGHQIVPGGYSPLNNSYFVAISQHLYEATYKDGVPESLKKMVESVDIFTPLPPAPR
jgi:hypothetical protein